MPTTLRRVCAATLLATGTMLATAATASAHVTVTGPGATRGGSDQEITFRVPVEKAVNTTELMVQLPLNTPIAEVLVTPSAGWTHTQETATLTKPIVTDDGTITDAVSEIDWKATSGGLKPGEFGQFTIIAGQLPDAASLTFKAIQGYADGSRVAWTQTEAPGSNADLDDPAPVLSLTAPAAGSTGTTRPPLAAAPASKTSSNGDSRGITALVVSVLALLLAAGGAVLAVRTHRASTTSH